MTHDFSVIDGKCCCIICGKWVDLKQFCCEGPEHWCCECDKKRTAAIRTANPPCIIGG